MIVLVRLKLRERVYTGTESERYERIRPGLTCSQLASRYDRQGHYPPSPAKSISRLRTETKGNDLP
jgi:hypothetical protein